MTNPIEGVDYFVRMIPFPSYRLGGVVTPNEDGTYSIYINSRLDSAYQRRAYEHEVRHIINEDLHGELDISTVEDI